MKEKTYQENLLKLFAKDYPDPKTELIFKNDYQLLISVVLSAQCTDKKVNHVTPELFKAYPDFKSLGEAKKTAVEKIIKPINYYITKSKNIIETGKMVSAHYGGKIPTSHEEIVKLPGVGRKTANVVLGELGLEKTLPVDTHVMRVSARLGLSSGKNPDKVEDELKVQFAPETWRNLHHYLILHGRRICKAQNPNCEDCHLNKVCPSAFAFERPAKN